ncbi:hypothetical protein C8R43DRAFT_1136155 [Mycena crocata]|nr:hypothetical protein C8R43DRAFT_1136155 [Mycena crocata]
MPKGRPSGSGTAARWPHAYFGAQCPTVPPTLQIRDGPVPVRGPCAPSVGSRRPCRDSGATGRAADIEVYLRQRMRESLLEVDMRVGVDGASSSVPRWRSTPPPQIPALAPVTGSRFCMTDYATTYRPVPQDDARRASRWLLHQHLLPGSMTITQSFCTSPCFAFVAPKPPSPAHCPKMGQAQDKAAALLDRMRNPRPLG